MPPIAVTPDGGTASTSSNGDVRNGYFSGVSSFLSSSSTGQFAPGATNGHIGGYGFGFMRSGVASGHQNGHAKDRINGVNGINANGVNSVNDFHGANSQANGRANGTTNGYSSTAKPKVMPIAIVGMACRLPGNVSTPTEFWELCTRARTGFSEIPKERFNNSSFYHPNAGKGGCQNAVGGSFLNVDLAAFDAPFFGLTEKEAISMDPQQRLLLECTFEALENAGIPKHTIVGKNVGVFVGGSFAEYESHLFRDSDTIPMHQATGCAHAMQSNRISHFFDLKGPSFTADTACSSSMVALHLACQSLRTGESSTALVGGCHLNMLPEFWISFSTCRLLSDSGRSISFDDRGTGFGRAQEELMRQVYADAGLNPSDCGFVEAHGIVSVIKAAMMLERGFILPNYDFKKPNSKIPWKDWNLKVPTTQRPWPRNKKYVSVNNFGFGGTNGHVVLEGPPPRAQRPSAIGDETPDKNAKTRNLYVFTANDKTALVQLMKRIVIYLEQRPEIFQMDLMNNVAYTLGQRRSLLQWRVAIPALNSFELIQAVNGEKYSAAKEVDSLRIGYIFTGQGAQWHAMGRELYEQYPVFKNSLDLADSCLSNLGANWSLIEELGKDAAESRVSEAHISQPSCTAVQLALVDLLQAWGVRPTAVAGHSSGEIGAAYAAGIITFESAMAIAYHRGRLIPILKERFPSLQGRMMAVGGSKEEVAPLIDGLTEKEVRIACFNSPSSLTISGDEPALAELEKLVEAKQMFNRRLVVDVAYHSHHMNLVAKEYRASIGKLEAPVQTSVKFHSSLYGQLISGTELQPNYWVDNLTCPVRFSEAVQSMLQPDGEHKTGVNMLVELGPHSALQGPIKQILKAVGGSAAKIPYASALIRKKDAVESAMELAGSLFTKGATLDLAAVNFPNPTKPLMLMTDLPRYPWNYQSKYWQESRMTYMHKYRPTPRSDVIGNLANYSNDLEPTWRNIVRLDDLPWLRHHRVQSLTLFPMAGFVSMALEAAGQRAALRDRHFDSFELKDVSITKPLIIHDKDVEVTITLRPYQEGTLASSDTWDEFRIHSWSLDQGWTEHCVGLVATTAEDINGIDEVEPALVPRVDMIQSAATSLTEEGTATINPSSMYDALTELGVDYGLTFQGIDSCLANEKYAVADITVPDIAKEMPNGYATETIVQPAFLESLIEMYWPVAGAGRFRVNTIYLPSSIQHLSVSARLSEHTKEAGTKLRGYCRGSVPRSDPRPSHVDLILTSGEDSLQPLIALDGLTVSPILDGETQVAANTARELCYKLEWDPILEPLHKLSNGTSNGTSNGSSNGSSLNSQGLSDTGVVIVHNDSSLQQLVALGVANALEQVTGRLPEVGSLSEVKVSGKNVVFIPEIDEPLLPDLSPDQFSSLQQMLMTCQGILWVVRGAYAQSTNPHANMVTGLSRTIRSETALRFATLDLDAADPLSESDAADAIVKVFTAAFSTDSSSTSELEFMERGGSFFTPRIVHDSEMDVYVHKQTNPSVLEPTRFSEDGRVLKMEVTTPGALGTLHFVDDPVSGRPLGSEEVEIEVKAVGLNYRDSLAAKGQTSIDDCGTEASGVVLAIGCGVTDLQVGDRVAIFTRGAFATRTRAPAFLAFKIPADMSFKDAATLPLAYSTAHYGLVELAHLREGETVLIHSAADSVGQAAVCISRAMGTEVFATVDSAEKKKLLMTEYQLPADHIFYSRGTSFRVGVQKHTNGRGVDVILNSLVGEALHTSLECLDKFGRFIDVSKGGHATKTRIEMPNVDNNISFISVDLLSIVAQRPNVMRRLVADVASLVIDGKARPIANVASIPVSDVEGALKILQTQSHGKVIVTLHPTDVVMATRSKKVQTLLRPDATYVLIGGTGGLGRSMARWMVDKGARHIVLVSRSGSVTGRVKELVDEVAVVGANIVVRKCNVANRADVDELLSAGLQGLPPVGGVVHGTMVLRDVLFEKMTWDDYTQVIEGKVRGGWNLHQALAQTPLDFFVVISSAAGAVGNRGQAAYSAANCFLNALVQHRLALGLPASSLDLTAVSDAGYLADDLEKAAEVARNLGSDTICEAEVLALLGAAIDGKMATTCNNHTITGMRITATMRPFWTEDAKFKAMRLAAEEAAAKDSSLNAAVSFGAALKASKTLEEAEDVVCRGLVDKIASVLMMEAEELDITRSLSQYPLDSLVAIEIRNFITREFEANLQVLELLSSGSIQNLAKGICTKSKLVSFGC
ncbi:hypothetical protein VTK73DRAFT_3540 [Phialemonium thermophilum]|uniref:Carrier domain-containing protein n=1 Tax=Phialemonium thermophilum TaxID=223376 RepID=A0ABR3XZN1_9PEZI